MAGARLLRILARLEARDSRPLPARLCEVCAEVMAMTGAGDEVPPSGGEVISGIENGRGSDDFVQGLARPHSHPIPTCSGASAAI